jgi:hypothetical protein
MSSYLATATFVTSLSGHYTCRLGHDSGNPVIFDGEAYRELTKVDMIGESSLLPVADCSTGRWVGAGYTASADESRDRHNRGFQYRPINYVRPGKPIILSYEPTPMFRSIRSNSYLSILI